MEKITITINTENAAFDDCPEEEVKRILHELAYSIDNSGLTEKKIRDINGNTVGSITIE